MLRTATFLLQALARYEAKAFMREVVCDCAHEVADLIRTRPALDIPVSIPEKVPKEGPPSK